MRRWTRSAGFSLIEALLASAVFVAVAAALFHFVAAGQILGRAQPEAADVNQRLRVAAGMIARDIASAGAGDPHGVVGALAAYLPPIVPARVGAQSPDPELTAFTDRISLFRVERAGWHARLILDMAAASDDLAILPGGPGCPAAGLCGFLAGTRAALIDTAGAAVGYEIFTVTHITGALGHGAPNAPFARPYTAASAVVLPMHQATYYHDAAGRRLMVYDGFKTAHPLVENVVDLRFQYFVDPNPASLAARPDPSGNCLFAPGDPPVPLLAPLGTGSLASISIIGFTDGPLCGVGTRRFDADQLRIRLVRVRIRVQAALERNRGAGADFSNPGTSRNPAGAVRDFEMTFDVVPRNMRGAP